jgi:predicted O-methyltransferase YrrM
VNNHLDLCSSVDSRAQITGCLVVEQLSLLVDRDAKMRGSLLFDRIRSLFRRARQFPEEEAALSSLPKADADPSPLRVLSKEKLVSIFASHDLNLAWAEVSAVVEDIVQIEDMKTAGVNPGDRRALFYLVCALAPRQVLEIGTNVGASTAYIGTAMREIGRKQNNGDPISLITVDIREVNDAENSYWKSGQLLKSPKENLAALGAASFTTFVTAESIAYLKANDAAQFDLIFLDGDHSARTVYQEVPLALKRLRRHGLILLHDYFPSGKPLWSDGSVIPGPYIAIERLRREGANLEVLPLARLPWPTKLSSNVTSLAILTRRS